MFRLSKGAEYAIRSILYLSCQPRGKVCYSHEVAKAQEIPLAYLAKVFQSLGKGGIIKSTRGTKGGVSLLKSPQAISLYDVIVAVEGEIFLNDCLIHKGYCHRDLACPAHFYWSEIQKKFCDYLKNINFEDMTEKAKALEKKNSSKN